jgi:hypothetical protein
MVLGPLLILAGLRAIAARRFWIFGILIGAVGLYNVNYVVRSFFKNASIAVDSEGLTVDPEEPSNAKRYAWNQVRACSRVTGLPLISIWLPDVYQLTYVDSPRVSYFSPGRDESMLEYIQNRVGQAERPEA